MKLKIYAIRDRATDSFDRPMFMVSHGQATRGFADEVNRAAADNPIYQHPEDYDLYYLGDYETDSGLFTTSTPEQLSVGKNTSIKNQN